MTSFREPQAYCQSKRSCSRQVEASFIASRKGLASTALHVIGKLKGPMRRLRIPSQIVTFRNEDKAWFNAECGHAYLDKQEAYHLWQRNRSQLTWNQFTRLRAVAQEVYASAEREYNNNVRETLLCTSHSI